MPGYMTDPEVKLLVTIAETIRGDYTEDPESDPWRESPFAWIRTRPSRQVGKIGEQLVAGWCAAKGLDVSASGDSEADRVIAGHRMEIKFSTLWKNGGYTFQQIRDQNYEYVICLGLSPFGAHCWIVPKQVMVDNARFQHAGSKGRDTRWVRFPAAEPPEWMEEWGGSLSEAFDVLEGLLD